MAGMDTVSLILMVLSAVLYVLSVIYAPDKLEDVEMHYDVYNALETAEIRVFLPHKKMNSTNGTDPSELSMFKVTVMTGLSALLLEVSPPPEKNILVPYSGSYRAALADGFDCADVTCWHS